MNTITHGGVKISIIDTSSLGLIKKSIPKTLPFVVVRKKEYFKDVIEVI